MINKRKKLILISILCLLFFSSSPAFAASANTIGAMATNVEGNLLAVKKLILSLFYMVGVVLFGAGLFLIYKDQKQPNQGHAKNGAISVLVGTFMLLIPDMVGVVSESVGADASKSKDALKSDTGF